VTTEVGEMDAAYRDGLLQRQAALQAEGRRVLDALDLEALAGRAGSVQVHGSFVTGLMVWRDVDLGVTAPGLTSADAFATMLPLVTDPHVARVRYQNEVGAFNPIGDPRDDRYFFVTYYRTEAGDEWKIDVPLATLALRIRTGPTHKVTRSTTGVKPLPRPVAQAIKQLATENDRSSNSEVVRAVREYVARQRRKRAV
jgi:hypothetical protein